MRINDRLSLAVFGGEPMVLFWRADDFDEALAAAQDMGLPLTMTAAVGEELGFYPDIFAPRRWTSRTSTAGGRRSDPRCT